MSNWTKPQKQSAYLILINLVMALKIMWPFVLIIVGKTLLQQNEDEVSKNISTTSYTIIGTALAILLIRFKEIFSYFITRFYVTQDNFVITTKFLGSKETIIPLSNIQTIHTQQTLLHKLTGTAKLEINTAGTNEVEATIHAINYHKAIALQQYLQEISSNKLNTVVYQQANKVDTIFSLSNTQLLKLAFTENHVKTFFIILIFVFNLSDDLKNYLGIETAEVIESKTNNLSLTSSLIVLIILITLSITLFVSCARIFIQYANLAVQKTSVGLRLQWGLFESNERKINTQKINQLVVHGNWLRRKLNLLILTFYVKGSDITKEKSLLKLPAFSTQQSTQLITQHYMPMVNGVGNTKGYTISPKYYWRKLFWWLVIMLPVCISLYAIHQELSWWYLLFFVVVVVAHNVVFQKKFCVYIWFNGIEINTGIWGTKKIFLQWKHVQHMQLKSSPYLSKNNLSTLVLHTVGENVVIPFIDKHIAINLYNYALAKNKEEHNIQQYEQNL